MNVLRCFKHGLIDPLGEGAHALVLGRLLGLVVGHRVWSTPCRWGEKAACWTHLLIPQFEAEVTP